MILLRRAAVHWWMRPSRATASRIICDEYAGKEEDDDVEAETILARDMTISLGGRSAARASPLIVIGDEGEDVDDDADEDAALRIVYARSTHTASHSEGKRASFNASTTTSSSET